MFIINSDKSIYLTRGDIAVIEVSADIVADFGNEAVNDAKHSFQPGDVIRFRVLEKNRCDMVVLQKDVLVESETISVDISLDSADTKLGELIHKPKDYWYEIELNPDTLPQTLIGYDISGPKIFRLFPEGDDVSEHNS